MPLTFRLPRYFLWWTASCALIAFIIRKRAPSFYKRVASLFRCSCCDGSFCECPLFSIHPAASFVLASKEKSLWMNCSSLGADLAADLTRRPL